MKSTAPVATVKSTDLTELDTEWALELFKPFKMEGFFLFKFKTASDKVTTLDICMHAHYGELSFKYFFIFASIDKMFSAFLQKQTNKQNNPIDSHYNFKI
jgi:hypothetical protein